MARIILPHRAVRLMSHQLNTVSRFFRDRLLPRVVGIISIVSLVIIGMVSCLAAGAADVGDATPAIDHAESVLEQLRAANVARAALTAEQAAWDAERERILAVTSANDADIDGLTKDGAEVEAERQQAAKQVASFEKADDLVPVHAQLDAIAATIVEQLKAYAQTTLPGAVTLPEHPGSLTFDEAVRCLDSSERAATSASIDIISGQLGGVATAVKVLRVSGAVAWWVALDEHTAGTLTMVAGSPQLQEVADQGQRRSIIRAIAILEGRRPAEFEVLPLPTPLALSAAAGPAPDHATPAGVTP